MTDELKVPLVFNVILEEASGGAKFNEETDGGEEMCVAKVHIGPTVTNSFLTKGKTMLMTAEEVKLGQESWMEQFYGAVYINGSYEDQQQATKSDFFWHVLSLPFKLVFALTPPTSMCGGFAAFFVSLVFIGALTAVVGDVASIFGCACGIPDEITAITFVALGTSLPDTFASKTAAMEEEYADASVGNVTGSNSVNVFLGLGIAWIVGALHWGGSGWTEEWAARYAMTTLSGTSTLIVEEYPSGGFVVPAGSLNFSVAVYSALAFISTVVLIWRRQNVGGELGGANQTVKIISTVFFFCLWLTYVCANIVYFIMRED
jgi:Ca2+/Na+ antiporter